MPSCGKPPVALKAMWSVEQERIATLREPEDRLDFEVKEVRGSALPGNVGKSHKVGKSEKVGKVAGKPGKAWNSWDTWDSSHQSQKAGAREWRIKLPEPTRHEFPGLKRVAGVDLSFFPDSRYAVAAVVVVSYPEMEVLFEHCATLELSVPYIPGYLALREVPALAAILRGVADEIRPDVVFVDGNGAFHPRQAGAATHLGVVTGLPTVGVAKDVMRVSTFCKKRALEIGRRFERPGDWAYFTDQDELTAKGLEKTAPLAALVRPGLGQKSLVVSSGHRVSLATAVALVRAMCPNNVVEPVRLADKISRKAVASWLTGTILPELAALARRDGDSEAEANQEDCADGPEPPATTPSGGHQSGGRGCQQQQQQQQQQQPRTALSRRQRRKQQRQQLDAASDRRVQQRSETIAKFDGPGSEELEALMKILPHVHATESEAPKRKKWRAVAPAEAPQNQPQSNSQDTTTSMVGAAENGLSPSSATRVAGGKVVELAEAVEAVEELMEVLAFTKDSPAAEIAPVQVACHRRSDCCSLSLLACWRGVSALFQPPQPSKSKSMPRS